MEKYNLPPGVVKVIAGLVQCSGDVEPFAAAIRSAQSEIGSGIADQRIRHNLTEAIRLNLISRRQWPYDLLQRKYYLPVSFSTFKREKYHFCYEVAARLGLVKLSH